MGLIANFSKPNLSFHNPISCALIRPLHSRSYGMCGHHHAHISFHLPLSITLLISNYCRVALPMALATFIFVKIQQAKLIVIGHLDKPSPNLAFTYNTMFCHTIYSYRLPLNTGPGPCIRVLRIWVFDGNKKKN